jgi:predicted metal-dependent hydrolase
MKMNPHAQVGLRQFNQGEFYKAHKYFETAWRETKDEGREFYRALLQICGGFFRLTQRRPRAAKKFFTRSLYWLGFFQTNYLGMDSGKLLHQVEELIEAINKNRTTENILDNFFPKIQGVFEEKLG